MKWKINPSKNEDTKTIGGFLWLLIQMNILKA